MLDWAMTRLRTIPKPWGGVEVALTSIILLFLCWRVSYKIRDGENGNNNRNNNNNNNFRWRNSL